MTVRPTGGILRICVFLGCCITFNNLPEAKTIELDYTIHNGILNVSGYDIPLETEESRINDDEYKKYIKFDESPTRRYILVMILKFAGSQFWLIDQARSERPQQIPIQTGLNVEVQWHANKIFEIKQIAHGYTINYFVKSDDVKETTRLLNVFFYEWDKDIYLRESNIQSGAVEIGSAFDGPLDKPVEFLWATGDAPESWKYLAEYKITTDQVLITFVRTDGREVKARFARIKN